MEDLWLYRDEAIGDIDLSGYSVEAADGSIGKVDEASYEIGSGYLVVDTGPWIFGKKAVLPAGLVDRIDTEAETVFVTSTKDEIKSSPDFDRDFHRDLLADADYRGRIGTYYAGLGTKRGSRI
jgi:hypothetical protein